MSYTATAGSTNLAQFIPGNFLNGKAAGWRFDTTESSTAISAQSFFLGQGAGSLGGSPRGLNVGDLVFVVMSTGSTDPGKVSVHSVISSTLNGSSLNSTYAFDVTVSAG